jgi:hypothetical protein
MIDWGTWLAMPSLTLREALWLSFNQDPDGPRIVRSDKTDSKEGRLRLRYLERAVGRYITPVGLADAANDRGWNVNKLLAALTDRKPKTYELATDVEILKLVEAYVMPDFTAEDVIGIYKREGIRFIKLGERVVVHKETDLIDGQIAPFRHHPYEWAPSVGCMLIGTMPSGSGSGGRLSGRVVKNSLITPKHQPHIPIERTGLEPWVLAARRVHLEKSKASIAYAKMGTNDKSKQIAQELDKQSVITRKGSAPSWESVKKQFKTITSPQ